MSCDPWDLSLNWDWLAGNRAVAVDGDDHGLQFAMMVDYRAMIIPCRRRLRWVVEVPSALPQRSQRRVP